jgi:TetR/AcrR family transcriptional regulator, transcriptional repressor for nem operon
MPTRTQSRRDLPGEAKETGSPTREHLVEVGVELMRKHGYGATGLQEILKAADVPKGSFYHHFGSKEEFAAAVIDRYVKHEEKHCREVLGNSRQAPLNRLRRYFEDLVRTAGQASAIQGCLIGSLSLEMAGSSPLLQKCISASFACWQTAIAAVVREAVERGDLPKATKSDALAGFILSSWEGALLRSQADRSDAPLDVFFHFIFDKILTAPNP